MTTEPRSITHPADATHAIPACVCGVFRTLRQNGHEAWLVGGCVRDLLLDRPPKDYDIVTDAVPERIMELFPKTIAVGKAFGIITVLAGDDALPVEVATFRLDGGYADGRHPDAIQFASAREDVLRRDFTLNALLWDPDDGRILDYVGGYEDIQNRLIRAIGDPARRFAEDKLRMLRAIRFATTLDFAIEPATFAAIQREAGRLTQISAERIRQELFRLLTEAQHPGRALALLQESGLLPVILPEVSAMIGVEQPPEFHPEGDVFTHTQLMLDALPPSPPLRLALAVLLHDVGKPPTASFDTLPNGAKRWRFENHAYIGAEMARDILIRLKAPAALIDEVAHMVGNHMRMAEAPKMRKAKLRRLLGEPTFRDELELHRLDCTSSHQLLGVYDFLQDAAREFEATAPLPPPLVRGRDLVALGYPPSPQFSRVLQQLYDRQLEEDTPRDALLAMAPELMGGPPPPKKVLE